MIATTIEQSERLLACGIKAETADMVYIITPPIDREFISSHDIQLQAIPYTNSIIWGNERKKPAWSLSVLLTRVLPRRLCGTNLNVIFDENECEINYSMEDCIGRNVLLENRYNDTVQVYDTDPLEACVKMVELLHEKNLI